MAAATLVVGNHAQGQAFNFSPGNLSYSENFDSMGAAGTTYVSGWTALRGGGSGTYGQTLPLTVSDGSATSGGAYNVGAASASDRAFGTLASGSAFPFLGASFTNSTGGTITNLSLAGFSEQWKSGSSSAQNEIIIFEYSLDATTVTNGNWTAISGMNLVELLTTTTTAAAVDGNVNRTAISGSSGLISWPNGTNLWIRWRDTDNAGSDGMYAIDDFSMTVEVQPPGLPPSIVDIQPTSVTTNAGNNVAFTVSYSGDSPSFSWYKFVGGVTNLVPSATTATLTLNNVLGTDTASYFVILANGSGSATSAVVTLTVNDPILVWGPVSQLNLEGSISGFSVNAKGSALQYQWYRGTPPSGTPLTDGGRISGAQTRFLTISNTAASDADNYYAIVSNTYGSITTDPATLSTSASAGTLVTWDFNALGLNPANVEPSQGQATARATTVGTTNSFQPSGGNGSPLDPYNSILGVTNYYFGTASYPNQTTSNKLVGAQFAVSTLGFKNLTVTYDHRASSTASRYTRLQYTINGTDYVDYPASSTFAITPSGASTWESRTLSLQGFPGVRNNPNFGIRVVSEFESTATEGAVANTNYVAINGNTATYNGGGTLSYDIVKVNAEPIVGGNTPPTISAISAQSTLNNVAKVVNFTVGDAETPVGSLTVSAISYNQTLVSDGNIVPGGSGSARNITITPNGIEGVVPILVTVTDGDGDVTSTWFNLTLNPLNSAPHITSIPNTNTLANTPLSIPFVIGDDSPVGGLTLATNSLNTNLIAFSSIAITGSGSNRVLTLTPAANTLGAAPVSISVSDGVNTTTTAFTLVVRPSTNVLLNDYFSYADGNLTNVSGYFWADHSGATPITVASGGAIIDGSKAQDCNAPLIGAPYATNSGVTLYSSFKVNFSVLPSSAGAYFAHFKDNTTFGFFGRVWAATNGASAGKFRLGIGNSSNASATSGQFPQDLDLNTTYRVVTRVALSNGSSTIWINPTSEADAHVTDTFGVTNSAGMYSYALRQASGEGTLAFDDLVVGKSFASVVPVLAIDKTGVNPVITWDNPTLPLQSAPLVDGIYTNIPAASSPYTDTSGNPQRYFRLFKP